MMTPWAMPHAVDTIRKAQEYLKEDIAEEKIIRHILDNMRLASVARLGSATLQEQKPNAIQFILVILTTGSNRFKLSHPAQQRSTSRGWWGSLLPGEVPIAPSNIDEEQVLAVWTTGWSSQDYGETRVRDRSR